MFLNDFGMQFFVGCRLLSIAWLNASIVAIDFRFGIILHFSFRSLIRLFLYHSFYFTVTNLSYSFLHLLKPIIQSIGTVTMILAKYRKQSKQNETPRKKREETQRTKVLERRKIYIFLNSSSITQYILPLLCHCVVKKNFFFCFHIQ